MQDARTHSGFDFEDVYRRGFLKRVTALLTGRQKEQALLSYDDVRQKIRCSEESYTGLKSVPVDAIVGSLGRYRDFDRQFLPLRRQMKERWRRIDEAHYESIDLPPVQLYKVGDVYFVKDGNHRVSVARERGIAYLDAEVIETRCRVPLTANIDADDLEEAGARALFLEWSRLDQVRPEQSIRVTVAGGYRDLEEHINVHRYFLGQERQAEVPPWEAVASWYDTIYLPVVRLIHEENALRSFPKRTEADLYLWVMDHLYFLRERFGDQVDAGDAVEELVQQRGRLPGLRGVIRRIAVALGRGGRAERREPPRRQERHDSESEKGELA